MSIKTIGIVGSGTMGNGTRRCAHGRLQLTMVDISNAGAWPPL